MVTDAYVRQLREIRRERRARLDAVRTRSDALKYQEHVRAAIARAFSPRPPKTPLNARVTGTSETKHGRIEKILFESRPGCVVSAALYLPHASGKNRRVPGVMADCGHAENGKLHPLYQAFPQRLSANGFATLIIDPFSQGERDQYHNLPKAERAKIAGCCEAHNMMGKQLELVGEFFGMWRAWDIIRGLDYLLTRPEIDPRHIGMTGNSGGGTMTTWTWAVEPRLTMAAPSCFVTSFLNNLENELPADNEQYPPGVVGAGLDHADFLIARAPEPVILLGQNLDYFDRRGLREAHREITDFYRVLGAGKKSALFIGPTYHGYSSHNQEAMVAFFRKQVGKSGAPVRLADKQVEDSPAKVTCTPKGQVVAVGSVPIYETIAATARQHDAARRARPLNAAVLARTVRKVLNIDAKAGSAPPPHFRILRPNTFVNYRSARYAVETEQDLGIRAFLQKQLPTRGYTLDVEKRVTLYLPHVCVEAELNDKLLGGKLIGKRALYALDVRGMGESLGGRPPEADYFAPYQQDYMHHGYGVLLSQSYLGRRVFDVLRTLDLLRSEGAQSVELVGRGQGALLAAYAALLAPKTVNSVTLINAPRSYLEWATTPIVRWPAANFPRNVLRNFDLPEIYRVLAPKLKMIAPWNAEMEPVSARTTYVGRGARKAVKRLPKRMKALVRR